ncbi:MAG: head to tail connecting protein [Caudoviricetes sp.]|nr:MAG: head to tail connecting protein [Caudoviricetes sp.]
MAQKASDILRLFNQSKTDRTPLQSHWQDAYDYTYPQLGQGFSGVQDNGTADAKKAALLDSTGTDATRTLASALISGMTPANAQWLNLSVSGQDAMSAAGHYLSQCAELVWKNIHSSNYDSEVYGSMLDFCIAGAFCLFVDVDRERGGFIFDQWPLAECWWASSTGRIVDTIFREHTLTAAQAYEMFGEKAGEKVIETLRKNPQEKCRYLHAIGPRRMYQAGGMTAINKPYYSVQISMADSLIVRESGFDEFPVMVPRGTKIPGTEYATGLVSDALPDIKELNELKRWEKAAAELAVAGMWIAQDDGVLNPRTVKIGPRKVIVASTTDAMKPLLTGSDFKVAFQSEASLQNNIRRTLMADVLTMANGSGQMTATEVNERMNIIRQQMAPMYGRLQAEFLIPMVERCFMLMLRNGALPTPPDEMNDTDFHVTFDNPLARAMKLGQASAIQQAVGFVAQYSQVLPGIADNIDVDAAARDLFATLGVPADIIKSSDDVDKVRGQRAAAMQAQQAQQMQDQLGMQNASEQITAQNAPAAGVA